MAAVVRLAYRNLLQHLFRVQPPCPCYLVNPFRPERPFSIDQYYPSAKPAFFDWQLGCNTQSVTYLGLATAKFAVEFGYGLCLYPAEQQLIECLGSGAAAKQRLSLLKLYVRGCELVIQYPAFPKQLLRCHDKGGSGLFRAAQVRGKLFWHCGGQLHDGTYSGLLHLAGSGRPDSLNVFYLQFNHIF